MCLASLIEATARGIVKFAIQVDWAAPAGSRRAPPDGQPSLGQSRIKVPGFRAPEEPYTCVDPAKHALLAREGPLRAWQALTLLPLCAAAVAQRARPVQAARAV